MDLSEIDLNSSFRHPWESERVNFIDYLLKSLYVVEEPIDALNVLDFGSGDGFLVSELMLPSRFLEKTKRVVLVDSNYQDLKSNDNRIIKSNALSGVNATFDLVLACDVLEHIEFPEAYLDELQKRMNVDGLMLITVPVYQWLFSSHDIELGHYRRYNKKMLHKFGEQSGLKQVDVGFFFPFLVFPAIVRRILSPLTRIGSKKYLNKEMGKFNFVMHLMFLKLDVRVSKVLRSLRLNRFGLSGYIVLQKVK